MNRREALKTGAVLATGAMLAPRLFANQHSHRFKIGACDWSIKKMLELDAFRMGRELGLDGIQFSFDAEGRGMDLRNKENRDAVRKVVTNTGVGITSLAIGLLNKIAYSSTEEGEQLVVDCIQTMMTLKKEAAQLDDSEIASKVSPEVVLLAFFGEGDINGKPDLIAKVIEKLKRIAPSAEKHGFILGLETWLNEDDHRHILENVDSPAVKVYYDVANSNKMGYDIYKEIESLGRENICEIHCKENGFLLGHGRIDFARLKGVINEIDYKDWLIIESAIPKGMEVSKAYKLNVEYMRSVFSKKT
ncbi:MAG: sugar phosphate isomerase/epimerase [Verrucomicrobia bacterium]|nr:sugar phosphate isomerase/epimerase [Verrucomicrobiota bacterium]